LTTPQPDLERLYREHRGVVWGLLYRLIGTAADADELTQETFTRFLAHPPSDRHAPLRPWLMQVAVNLGRDLLRQRRRQPYVGPWLPSPIELDIDEDLASPAARYQTLESASTAFLVALEELAPTSRAVLILRDVLDRSVDETASLLGLSAGNVRVIHHRARAALDGYEKARPRDDAGPRTLEALHRLVALMVARDLAGLTKALVDDALLVSDAGGEFLSALQPVRRASPIARFLLGTSAKLGTDATLETRNFNGLPALVVRSTPNKPEIAPTVVLQLEVEPSGLIRTLRLISAPRKLTAVTG
jgi:RNA polymerase sigma factor (sigma-70 family)